MKKGITQSDIAKKLNVSRITVSKAINGSKGVSKKVREKIIREANESGYFSVPEGVLVNNTKNEFKDIVFLGRSDFSTNNFWMDVIHGVEHYLSAHDATVRLVFASDDQIKSDVLPSTLALRTTIGIIMAGAFTKNYYEKVNSLGIPMVIYDFCNDSNSGLSFNNKFDIVTLKDEYGIYELTNRLIEKGHKKIVFVGDEKWSMSFYKRGLGFKKAMLENDINPVEISFLKNAPADYDPDIEVLEKGLLNLKDIPTAYVCANDNIAYKLLMLKKSKSSVFKNIEVCGFDNSFEHSFDMQLFGTVECHKASIGIALARQILARIEMPSEPHCLIQLDVSPIYKE